MTDTNNECLPYDDIINGKFTLDDFMKNIIVDDRKKTESGWNIIIKYKDGENKKILSAITPTLRTPFGLTEYKENFSIGLALPKKGNEPNEKVKIFCEFLRKLEEKMFTLMSENSKEWLGKKKLSEESFEDNFTRIIKVNKDESKNYDPLISLKMAKKEGGEGKDKYWAKCFQKNPETKTLDQIEINQESLVKGTEIAAYIQFASIWLINGKYGVTMRVKQLRVINSPNGNGNCLIPDSDDDNSDDSDSDDDDKVEDVAKKVDDSEDDDSE